MSEIIGYYLPAIMFYNVSAALNKALINANQAILITTNISTLLENVSIEVFSSHMSVRFKSLFTASNYIQTVIV